MLISQLFLKMRSLIVKLRTGVLHKDNAKTATSAAITGVIFDFSDTEI